MDLWATYFIKFVCDERVVPRNDIPQSKGSIIQAGKDVAGLAKLLEYGRTKGFQNFLNRKTIWPFLLKVDPTSMSGSHFEWDG